MSFCVAGVTLCDIPTCLIKCRKCQNWRKSRTKMLLLLRPRVSSRVSGASFVAQSSTGNDFVQACCSTKQYLCASFVVQGSIGKCFVQAL